MERGLTPICLVTRKIFNKNHASVVVIQEMRIFKIRNKRNFNLMGKRFALHFEHFYGP